MRFNAAALTIILCLGQSANAKARPYAVYLSTKNPELMLARIARRPRLMDEQWLKMLGPRSSSHITVRPGDTLWTLSGHAFGNPYLWRKLWQENPEITNPHEIEVGRVLQYYRETPLSRRGLASDEIPVVKLVPSGVGSAADLDSDSFINIDLKNRYRPMLLVVTEQEFLGEVSGSYGDTNSITPLDKIYLRMNQLQGVAVGNRFCVVRKERELKTRQIGGEDVSGVLVRVYGEVMVNHVGDKLALAQVTSEISPIQRGDKLIAAQKVVEWSAAINPPLDLKTKILGGEQEEVAHYSQGALVLLDKGEAEGVKTGFRFRVYRDTDPVTDKQEGVIPDYKGEVQVVHAGRLSSIGYILRNTIPITDGDVLVAPQNFPEENEIRGKRAPRQTIEIP